MKYRQLINVLLTTAAFAATAAPTKSALAATAIDCRPERLRATADRMDMRCVGVDRWFIAWRSNTNVEQMRQMIELVNSAIVSEKALKLYYDVDSSGTSILWGVELWR